MPNESVRQRATRLPRFDAVVPGVAYCQHRHACLRSQRLVRAHNRPIGLAGHTFLYDSAIRSAATG